MFSKNAHNKSNIQEANKHLELLHTKINDIEKQLAEKEILFGEREKELSNALEFSIQSKDSEVSQLRNEISNKDVELKTLFDKLKEKDTVITRLQHKCAVLDYIAKHKNVFEEIVSVLSGVQRLDQKGLKEDRTSFAKELCELSRKTEAHGISEGNHGSSHSIQPSVTSHPQQSYHTFDGRFSISEVEEDVDHDDIPDTDLPDDVFSKQPARREHYL
jgi:hypothetical protein